MTAARRRRTPSRIVLAGMLVGIALLTLGSLPFLGIGAVVVPIVLVPLWFVVAMILAHRTGRWSPSRGWAPSPPLHDVGEPIEGAR